MSDSLEMSTDLPSVAGRENEGKLILVRWLAAPSSCGFGRSVGKDVSNKYVLVHKARNGLAVKGTRCEIT